MNVLGRELVLPAPWYAFWRSVFAALPQPSVAYIEAHAGRIIWDVFDDMMNDPRIEAAWSSRLSGVASRDWTVVAGQAPEAAASLVSEAIDAIDGWQDALEGLLHAIPQGYAVVEVIWDEVGNRLLPARLVERHPAWFRFDGQGRLYVRRPGGNFEPAPDYKFVVHTYKRRFGDPRGRPVLARCYWPWYVKTHAAQFWAMFVEKFGDPPLLAKGVTPALKDEVIQLLLNLRRGGVATLPQGIDVDSMSSKVSSGHVEIFSTLLDFCDKEMTLAFLGQTLTTEIREGSFAAAQVHMRVRQDIIERDITALEDTLNRTLVTWTVDLNLGPQTAYPYIRFDRKEEVDIQVVKTAWEMGYPIPLDEVQRITRIRRAGPDEEILPSPPNLIAG